MYGLTEQVLRAYGYGRYEISNYAKEGCECRQHKLRHPSQGGLVRGGSLPWQTTHQIHIDMDSFLRAQMRVL